MTALKIIAALAVLLGIAIVGLGAVFSFISAEANMSLDNPLPRAGCAFVLAGIAIAGLGIWGLRQ